MGSLGDEVAQAIAYRLNYRVVSREIINQAALRSGAPEMALATIDELDLLGIQPTAQARYAYQLAVELVMKELADEGEVVIIGRAGQVILHNHPNVFHVKVIAPSALRAERIARRHNLSLEAAKAQIETSDRNRKNYLKRYYRARWDDPELYDLIINTDRLDPEQAACLICQALTHCDQRAPYASYDHLLK